MPAFVRAFLFKSSPNGELSYKVKKELQSPFAVFAIPNYIHSFSSRIFSLLMKNISP